MQTEETGELQLTRMLLLIFLLIIPNDYATKQGNMTVIFHKVQEHVFK